MADIGKHIAACAVFFIDAHPYFPFLEKALATTEAATQCYFNLRLL